MASKKSGPLNKFLNRTKTSEDPSRFPPSVLRFQSTIKSHRRARGGGFPVKQNNEIAWRRVGEKREVGRSETVTEARGVKGRGRQLRRPPPEGASTRAGVGGRYLTVTAGSSGRRRGEGEGKQQSGGVVWCGVAAWTDGSLASPRFRFLVLLVPPISRCFSLIFFLT
jgi:hypothetical protein